MARLHAPGGLATTGQLQPLHNCFVNTFEVLIWATTAGAILLMATIALVMVLINRSRAAAYTFLFLASSGASVLLMSGLVELVARGAHPRLVLMAKLGVVLLSSSIAVSVLGKWLGASGRDRMVHWLIRFGRVALLVAAMGLVVASAVLGAAYDSRLLQLSAVANFVGIVAGALAAVRTALLGDRVAWFMVVACGCVAAGAASLHAHAINPGQLGLLGQAMSALLMLVYFVIAGWLAVRRDVAYRRIQHRLRASDERDPLTKLAQGAALLGHIERAAQRSIRLRRECAVIAISIKNLYTFNDEVGYDVDHEVAVALAARIRHLAGIHNAVGQYHPSCFVVVVAAVQVPSMLRTLGLRLASGLRKPLSLTRLGEEPLSFKADVGIGIARLDGDLDDASFALEEAEHLANQARGFASRTAIRGQHDDEATPVESYVFAARKRRTQAAVSSITRY